MNYTEYHMPTNKPETDSIWKAGWKIWLALLVVAVFVALIYHTGIKELLRIWGVKEEYSYGYMIPFITAFLIWQRKDRLERQAFKESWFGFALVFLAILLLALGRLSTVFLIEQISLVLLLIGVAWALMGWASFKMIAVPLLILFFMIPLPQFFLAEISQQLQFLSSEIGVVVIRLFGISVYLEGNVIDLGSYKLQVVEACSGLRYLFPLMTLGFIAAYFFNGAFWKRTIIFLSTIPITVLMNSFRIGVIGVMVEYWGASMAEGFLHDFEGWIVFMACTALLVLEMWFLAKVGKDRLPLQQAFGIEFPGPTDEYSKITYRKIEPAFIISCMLLAVTALVVIVMPDRIEIKPDRKDFSEFSMTLPGWSGRGDLLESVILNELRLSDYLLADYVSDTGDQVNLYVAYYGSQRQGQSAHSPRTCLPGGGWKIKSLVEKNVDGVVIDGKPLHVNRVLIQKGEHRQLVYYWFQQRSRIITNEYLVKWYIFWDSLIQNRSDGALVRLVYLMPQGGEESEADRVLNEFASLLSIFLDEYIPK